MRFDAAPSIVLYVGRDPRALEALGRVFSEPLYRVEQADLSIGRLQAVSPSWRCECVVVIDHLEDEDTVGILEDLWRQDAGIPVVALVDGGHPARLTAAGLARLHGVHRLVVKPWSDPSALESAVESGFAWLDHWKMYLTQPLPLACAPAQSQHDVLDTRTSRPGKPKAVTAATARL